VINFHIAESCGFSFIKIYSSASGSRSGMDNLF
jgi:hypothetical protein